MNPSASHADTNDTGSLPSYQDYPPSRPFINSDYVRDTEQPINSYPESSREAIMDALKSLQDKIRQLELERSSAENQFDRLKNDASTYHESIKENSTELPHNISRQNYELEIQLQEATGRSQLLEKQLEYMRKMLQSAEQERSDALKRQALIENQRVEGEEERVKVAADKINSLEKQHLKLTASQTLADNKIRELQEALQKEQHLRKLAQQARPAFRLGEDNSTGPTNHGRQTSKRRKKQRPRDPRKDNKALTTRVHPVADKEHYKLNLAGIPFVAGKSVSPSHSLPANMQQVLSQMKTHNKLLCESTRGGHWKSNKFLTPKQTSRSNSVTSSTVYGDELEDLLAQLHEEFSALTSEHQELSEQLAEAVDPRVRDDQERELEQLVARMDAKGAQIERLRKHQTALDRQRQRSKSASTARVPLKESDGEVEVTTTIRTRGGRTSPQIKSLKVAPNKRLYLQLRPCTSACTGKAQASLRLLKDLKKIQNTLCKDDICWDDC